MTEICTGNCEGCPRVSGIVEEHAETGEVIKFLSDQAMSPDLEKVAPRMFEMLQSAGILEIPVLTPNGMGNVETPEDLVAASRVSLGKIMEMMDKDREEKKAEAEGLTQGCEGPLKMRATRDGVTVTVSVCMSPQTPESPTTETALVIRDRSAS